MHTIVVSQVSFPPQQASFAGDPGCANVGHPFSLLYEMAAT